MLRFEDALYAWSERRLTQEEAAQLLGVCERTFRRYVDRYEEAGLDGLLDKRLSQVSARRAPVDEVMRLEALYRESYQGWSVAHFHDRYRERHAGERSYTWVKNRLQESGLVSRGKARGTPRRRRERAAIPGLLVHQDGSTHKWVAGAEWDLIVTMDDATSEVYSGFFVEEEGTWSSLRGVGETLAKRGLFCGLYTDRGSHYWRTPAAGGKVDRGNPTQFGRAMGELGIEMIPSYSPEARGRSERFFGTVQGRLPRELAHEGIADMADANRYLRESFWPRMNRRFGVAAREQRQCVRAAPGRRSGRHPVPEGGAHGGARQLRELSGPAAATAGRPRAQLRQAAGSGARARGRRAVGVPRSSAARQVRRRRRVAGRVAGAGGRLTDVRRERHGVRRVNPPRGSSASLRPFG